MAFLQGHLLLLTSLFLLIDHQSPMHLHSKFQDISIASLLLLLLATIIIFGHSILESHIHFFLSFIYLGGGQGRGRENLKQILSWAWSSMQGLIPWPWDHDLSQNQELDAQPTESPRRPVRTLLFMSGVLVWPWGLNSITVPLKVIKHNNNSSSYILSVGYVYCFIHILILTWHEFGKIIIPFLQTRQLRN